MSRHGFSAHGGALTGPTEVRRRRADFAEFPRLEAQLEPAEGAREPAPLVVYYLGVPDTTPEFSAEELSRRGAHQGPRPPLTARNP